MNWYSEIQTVTLGVRSLTQTRAFYETAFGYRCVDESTVSHDCAGFWGVPAGVGARTALLARAAPDGPVRRGMIRLLECTPAGEHAWGRYERYFDYGHYAVNIRVPDIRTSYDTMLEAGASSKSRPTRWEVEPGLEAWDSLSWDPDGTLIDVYTVSGRPDVFAPIQGLATEVETVAIHTSDARRSRDFYLRLGYSQFYDRLITDLSSFFHLPEHVALHNINLFKPERSPVGRIEIVQYVGLPGEPVGARARPPRLGILAIAFETQDVGAAQDRLRQLGSPEVGAVTEIELPGIGRVRTFAADSPDRERLEFHQRC
jgi:catechol 2,3-dioxygenase-like lactoylglutathione lyase family enzyme